MQSQNKIDQLLQRRAAEICEIETKYYELLKNEYLVRSIEIKKIPLFWYKCLRNHHTLPSLITEKDWEALQHIDDLSLDEFTSRNRVKTYKLTIEFKPNPFINNNSLWAAINTDELQSYSGSGIDFKAPNSISILEEQNKPSFFNIFIGTEGDSALSNSAFVYDIINGIRIDIWEDPLKYYEA